MFIYLLVIASLSLIGDRTITSLPMTSCKSNNQLLYINIFTSFHPNMWRQNFESIPFQPKKHLLIIWGHDAIVNIIPLFYILNIFIVQSFFSRFSCFIFRNIADIICGKLREYSLQRYGRGINSGVQTDLSKKKKNGFFNFN